MSIYCNWRPVLAVYAELVVFCSVPVRHADGSSFMACLAVVQWDTGSWWPCPCSHTPFACSFALSWIMGAGVGAALPGIWNGVVAAGQQLLLLAGQWAHDGLPAIFGQASWCWPGMPSPNCSWSHVMWVFSPPVATYGDGRPFSFLPQLSLSLPWDYCSVCTVVPCFCWIFFL